LRENWREIKSTIIIGVFDNIIAAAKFQVLLKIKHSKFVYIYVFVYIFGFEGDNFSLIKNC